MNTSRARSCQNKRRHPTYAGAAVALRLTSNIHGDPTLRVYRCTHCGGFHIGHPGKAAQRRLRFTRMVRLIEYAVSH